MGVYRYFTDLLKKYDNRGMGGNGSVTTYDTPGEISG